MSSILWTLYTLLYTPALQADYAAVTSDLRSVWVRRRSGAMPEEAADNVLALAWAFGFSRDVTVHNLCDDNRSAIFYVSAHTGVIYDLTSKTQQLLQGHVNPISCTCVSADRRWIATADRGADSMVVLSDSYAATPVKTISMPHPGGVRVMDLSPDAR